MRRISVRVFVYFGVVILAFSALIGALFTRFNKNNIIGAYKNQLGNLATAVARQTSIASEGDESEGFQEYLRAIEDFGDLQNIDIWVVSKNSAGKKRLPDEFANVDVESVDIPEETNRILKQAYEGKTKNYSDYDNIYRKNMLHIATPVRNNMGTVIGAIIVSGPVEDQETAENQYQKYITICICVGLVLAMILALFFSRQLVRPILKVKESALILAAGKYDHKTGINRKDEIGLLAQSMDVLSQRLVDAEKYREEIEQNRRDFFSNVSHELRTPIAVVKGYADTLAVGLIEDKAKQQEYLERIQNECGSMEKLVSDLLILSRMQNPDYVLNVEVINVIAVAQDAMRGIRILMRSKNMDGKVTYDNEMSFVKADYDRIRQLFTILLQNAVKYGDENTTIDIDIKKEDGYIVSVVRDYGTMIPEDEKEHVFEKFFRASTHGEKEGSGLGLVVAYHIVERHGGEISVESDEKEGTRFIVKLPETDEEFE